MLSLSDANQSEVIEAFISASRYLDDLLNIDNNFFDSLAKMLEIGYIANEGPRIQDGSLPGGPWFKP